MTQTTEPAPLVERLRTRPTGDPYLHMMVHEAADEIERLRARVLELEAVHEDASGAVLAERERCAVAAREVAEGYRSTEWGKAAECIGDACIAAIRRA